MARLEARSPIRKPRDLTTAVKTDGSFDAGTDFARLRLTVSRSRRTFGNERDGSGSSIQRAILDPTGRLRNPSGVQLMSGDRPHPSIHRVFSDGWSAKTA